MDIKPLLQRANDMLRNGQYEEALDAYRDAEPRAREAGDALTLARVLTSMSQALRMLDRYEEALQASEQAAEAAREAGDALTLAQALDSNSDALRILDRYEEAVEVSEEAVEPARQAGDALTLAQVLHSKTEALGMLGRYEDALQASNEAEQAARKADRPRTLGQVLDSKSQALRILGRYEEALQASEAAEQAAREADRPLTLAQALMSKSLVLMAIGRYSDALDTVQNALEVCGEDVQGATAQQLRDIRSIAEAKIPIRGILQNTKKGKDEFIEQLAREPTPLRGYEPPRMPEGSDGALVLLRGWASYTTIPLARSEDRRREIANRVAGSRHLEGPGGYLLRWRGKGLAIDPGIGFLEGMEAEEFVLRHIDEVLLTHYHVDHLGDLLQLLACAHELRDAPKGDKKHVQHDLRFYASRSCHEVYQHLLKATSGQEAERLAPTRQVETALGGRLRIKATPAQHLDLMGGPSRDVADTPGIGVHLRLVGENRRIVCRVGVTGDTGWSPRVSKAFAGSKPVDLLVLHIGGVYKEDDAEEGYAENHLGLKGAKQLLADVEAAHQEAGTEEWLAVVSEWGEELRDSRNEICTLLQEDLTLGRVIPGEFGLYIALPQCKPLCQVCRNEYATRWVTDHDGHICYVCDEHVTRIEAEDKQE